MYSLSKIPLNADVIQAIVTQHFGTQRKIAVFEELHEGFFNAAAKITLDDGLQLVLKAAPRDDVKGLRYEKDIMRAEVESMRLVRAQTSVPVPDVLVYDTSRKTLPSDFFMMSCLPGIPLHKIRSEIPPERQVEIERELGRMAFEISGLTNPAFGYWSQPQKPGTTWRETFIEMLNWVLDDGRAMDVKLPMPYEDIFALMARHFEALDEITTPRLVHWDLWDGNVFVEPPDFKITGLIDFERALWADPLMEAFFGFSGPDSHFVEGFGHGIYQTRNQVRRRMLYNAYLWLIMIIETYYRQYDNNWQINFATEKMKAEIELLAA